MKRIVYSATNKRTGTFIVNETPFDYTVPDDYYKLEQWHLVRVKPTTKKRKGKK